MLIEELLEGFFLYHVRGRDLESTRFRILPTQVIWENMNRTVL